MSEIDGLKAFQNTLLCYDTPAYIQRAQGVAAEWFSLLTKARQKRRNWLTMVALNLGQLQSLTEGNFAKFEVFSQADQRIFELLLVDCQPELKRPLAAAHSRSEVLKIARKLVIGLERFNKRWTNYVEEVDFGTVNQLRQGYNDYYVLEKECVVLSANVAQQGFEPLPMATCRELLSELPLLPVPVLYESR